MSFNNILKYFVVMIFSIIFSSCLKKDVFKPNPRYESGESTLPTMYIEMPEMDCYNIHMSKEKKAEAECMIVSSDKDTIYSGSLSIKTRGNWTFSQTKKPYSIEFPKKNKLFNLHRSKHYILLANVIDQAHIRNAIAFDVAERMSVPAPRYTYLRLFINGDYRGLYQLTNKVEVNKGYLPIENLESANKHVNLLPLKEYPIFDSFDMRGRQLPNNPMDITGGYIIDHHMPKMTECGFRSNYGSHIRIKSPKHASVEEVDYLAKLYNDMEAAVCDSNGVHPITGKKYSDYIDIESFAIYYLIEEWMKNYDAGVCSFMMYKDIDSISPKIYAGPIWDFDNTRIDNYNELWAACRIGKDTTCRNEGGILYHLYLHNDFRQRVEILYQNELYPILNNMICGTYLDSLCDIIRNEAKVDAARWGKEEYSFEQEVNKVVSFLSKRKDFMRWLFSAEDKDVICVSIHNKDPFVPRKILRYATKEDGVLFKTEYPINNNPNITCTCYLAETNTLIKHDTTFFENADVVIQYQYRTPSRVEVYKQRIKKKLKRLLYVGYQ